MKKPDGTDKVTKINGQDMYTLDPGRHGDAIRRGLGRDPEVATEDAYHKSDRNTEHEKRESMMELPGRLVCAPRHLPRNDWPRAATNAIAVNPGNRPPGFEEDEVPMGSEGEKLAVDVTRYWGQKGAHLTVGFFDTHEQALRKRILLHFNAWGRGANVSFVESDAEPQVRIARWNAHEAAPGDDGYWSNLGTDILLIQPHRPTMNLEAFTMKTPESEFLRVVRHEAGHTLGFPHEHMRKAIIERLDREKVIRDYMKTQGWTRQEVIDQVLTPLEEASLLGTPMPEADSIMCYQISGDLTLDGKPIVGGTDITPGDYLFVAQIYPEPQRQPCRDATTSS